MNDQQASTETGEAAQVRAEAVRVYGLHYPRQSWQGDGQVLTTFANGCPMLTEGPQVDDL